MIQRFCNSQYSPELPSLLPFCLNSPPHMPQLHGVKKGPPKPPRPRAPPLQPARLHPSWSCNLNCTVCSKITAFNNLPALSLRAAPYSHCRRTLSHRSAARHFPSLPTTARIPIITRHLYSLLTTARIPHHCQSPHITAQEPGYRA